MVPKSLRENPQIFLYCLSVNFLNGVLSYSPNNETFELGQCYSRNGFGINFAIWNWFQSKLVTYLDLAHELHPETNIENRLIYNLCYDIKNKREKFLELIDSREDGLGIEFLLEKMPLAYLIKMDDFIHDNEKQKFKNGSYLEQDKIALIFKKIIFRKRMMTPFSLFGKMMDFMFLTGNRIEKKVEQDKNKEWLKLQLNI